MSRGVKVTRTERGWPGHFILADRCLFHRNTLLQAKDGIAIVVSTVGLLQLSGRGPAYPRGAPRFDILGPDRYFETMAFHADLADRWLDADVSRQIYFESPWCINKVDADDEANAMHDAVVEELVQRMRGGETFESESP